MTAVVGVYIILGTMLAFILVVGILDTFGRRQERLEKERRRNYAPE